MIVDLEITDRYGEHTTHQDVKLDCSQSPIGLKFITFNKAYYKVIEHEYDPDQEQNPIVRVKEII